MDNDTINSKIDAIKLVRAFVDMGLKDSKIIAEAWESAYCNDFHCSNLKQIRTLGCMARLINSGEWFIDEKDEIIVKRVINNSDIQNLLV